MTTLDTTLPQDRSPFPRRGHFAAFAFAATVLAIYGSYVPLEFKHVAWDDAVEKFRNIRYLSLGLDRRADWVANLLLFVPLGFFWIGAVDVDQRRRLIGFLAAPVVAAALAALAMAIEFGQLWTANRTVSQNDIIAECIGGCVGVAVWFGVGRLCVAWLRKLFAEDVNAPPIKRLLQLYFVGLVLYNLQPFDIAFSPEAIRAKIEGGKVLLRPFAHGYKNGAAGMLWHVVIGTLQFIPVGIMIRLRGRGMRTVFATTLLAACLAVVIEAVQLALYSRYTDVTDIIISTLGGLIGAMLAPRFAGPRGEGRTPSRLSMQMRILIALGLLAVYMLPLLSAFCHPFSRANSTQQIFANLRGFLFPPFKLYYGGSEFEAITGITRAVMLFIPIGALMRWALGPRKKMSALLWCVVAGIGIGLVIEVAQAALKNIYADTTDLGIYTTGAVLGWAIAQMILHDEKAIADL